MVNVSVARRYARALLEVAGESSRLDAVGEQLTTLARVIAESPELAAVLHDPSYSRDQRRAVTLQVMDSVQANDPVLVNVIQLLIERNRMAYLPDIARAYRTLADARVGRVRGSVVSAMALDAESLRRLEQALEQLTQRNVVLESLVDPSVLGGVSAQVGSVVYDGTLRTQLELIRRNLAQG